MAQNMSKADLIDRVSEQTGMAKKDVKTAVDGFVGAITEQLNSGGKVSITGFGSFEVRERQAREGVKPGTTDRIQIPASKYPAFKPGKGLKDQVK
jgi:DNA-binding protein HU-beta